MNLTPRWKPQRCPFEVRTFSDAWAEAVLWECRWCVMFNHPLFPGQRFEFHRPVGI